MDKIYYQKYATLEQSHWWFKARLKILRGLIRKNSTAAQNLHILNAGAATGATTVMLQEFGTVVSVEIDNDSCAFLSEILHEEVINASLTELPLNNGSFDLVCAFDVIEHIENEHKAVSEIYRVLKSGGRTFITVPAYQFLWSKHDEINHHFRRYQLIRLEKLFEKQGFSIEYKSYFNFFLFIPIFFVRMLSNLLKTVKGGKISINDADSNKFNFQWLNNILYYIFLSESYILKRKLHFPFGVSAILIARKNEVS